MDEEIQEELEKIYKCKIEVEFKEFRIYNIIVIINSELQFSLSYLYNGMYTMKANVNDIVEKIDKEIAKCFKKEGK